VFNSHFLNWQLQGLEQLRLNFSLKFCFTSQTVITLLKMSGKTLLLKLPCELGRLKHLAEIDLTLVPLLEARCV
jgi:hypothetical protein